MSEATAEFVTISGPCRSCKQAGCVLCSLGITYRRLDHWCRSGWLRPENGPAPGTGRSREWPEAELEIARRMAKLTAAGISVPVAAKFARDAWPVGEIAPGVGVWIGEHPDEMEATA